MSKSFIDDDPTNDNPHKYMWPLPRAGKLRKEAEAVVDDQGRTYLPVSEHDCVALDLPKYRDWLWCALPKHRAERHGLAPNIGERILLPGGLYTMRDYGWPMQLRRVVGIVELQ